MKEYNVLDGLGNVFQIATTVECKGVLSSDDMSFFQLDLDG